MKEFYIGPNEAGQRMDKYLHKLLKEASNSFIYKMLRKKNIVLNGNKSDGNEKLLEKDKITLFLADETFEKFVGSTDIWQESLDLTKIKKGSFKNNAVIQTTLDIVYEDKDILIINKPAGMLSQKAAPTDISANEYILEYLIRKGEIDESQLMTFRPSICNRLDRNTSGLLIAGKSLKGLQEMSLLLKDRSLKKYYRCVVQGKIESPSEIEGYLWKDEKKNQVKILENEVKDSKYIKTAYRPIKVGTNATLLEVHLITGRSHQIRAHLASIGHPIAGDQKYGDAKWNKALQKNLKIQYQLLHAYKMIFPDGRQYMVDYPEIFDKVVQTY